MFHRAGADVVARVAGAHAIPLRTLRDVARFPLAAGATAGVSFVLDVGYAASLVNASGARNAWAGTHHFDVWDGGANNITVDVVLGADSVVSVPPLP